MMRPAALLASLVLTGSCLTAPLFAQAPKPPETPVNVVTDTYHGTKVEDPYRWLEDWNDPKVKAWSEAQNEYTRAILDKLPNTEAIRARVTEVLGATSESYSYLSFHGGKLFALKRQPPKQQPFLVVMDSIHHPDKAAVLVDPNVIDKQGTTAIDWFVPSPDGRMVAVSLSSGGSESGDVHVFEVATGKQVFEVVPGVQYGTGGGALAWTPDAKGFYYTRYPRAGERPEADRAFYMQLYYHELGTPTEKDRYEIGKEFPKIAEVVVFTNDAGVALVNMQKGDGGEFQHYVRTLDGKWHELDSYEDRVVQAEFGHSDSKETSTVLMVSRMDAPRGQLLKHTFQNDGKKKVERVCCAEVLIPQGEDTLVSEFGEHTGNLIATPSRLYVTYQKGGPSEVRVYDHKGKLLGKQQQHEIGDVSSIVPIHGAGDSILFSSVSYTSPSAWFSYDATTGKTARVTTLSQEPKVSWDDVEVVREFATSKDGTKVPVNIVRRKGIKQDGSHPCLITAYGGYGVNIAPRYRPEVRILLEQGFVWAEANIRGGGEYGEEWHHQGNLTNKQNVFDDFYAACQHMVKEKYTSNDRLAIMGGSNGGLLMGATFTQHPEVAKCVIASVGIYDMLRVELSANGEYNIPEFGTVKDPEQFKALYAYSPYHHVKEGVAYPAVLFLTGANDPRVDPMQSRKMTARLQAVGGTALLRTSANSGHGMGSSLSQRIEQVVDMYAFLFDQVGVEFKGKAGRQGGKSE
ncbi:MAG TPA: prolyl oligopeptidase family serine peptidase [Phycisphaerales bacterium]|nr:prolyl oligopeptidase family serine peptidase [Phycisphaerales bacterium]